jgi:transposase
MGKLLLVTNVPDLKPAEIVSRYKALADIERGIQGAQVRDRNCAGHHRLPQRIRAHAMLCFIALIVYRVMRQTLATGKSDLSPEKALAQLRRIQHHSVRINAAAPISGISTVNALQSNVFAALNTEKTDPRRPMSLL